MIIYYNIIIISYVYLFLIYIYTYYLLILMQNQSSWSGLHFSKVSYFLFYFSEAFNQQ